MLISLCKVETQPPQTQRSSREDLLFIILFLNKDFTQILTVLACYQLVNVDESDLENPEMYFWAANLFLRGNGSPYIIE